MGAYYCLATSCPTCITSLLLRLGLAVYITYLSMRFPRILWKLDSGPPRGVAISIHSRGKIRYLT